MDAGAWDTRTRVRDRETVVPPRVADPAPPRYDVWTGNSSWKEHDDTYDPPASTRNEGWGRFSSSRDDYWVPSRAGYRDPRTGDVLKGDIRIREQDCQSSWTKDNRTFLMYDAPASSQREQAPRSSSMGRPRDARPRHSMYASHTGIPSSWGVQHGAESTTGVSRNNEEYSRIVNHDQCDQDLLHICIRAIHLKQHRTGQAESQPEEFLWRCLAKPEQVRLCLKQEATYHFPYRNGDPVKYLIRRVGEIKEQWMPEVHSNQRWRFPCAFCGQRPYVSWDACFRCGSLRGTI